MGTRLQRDERGQAVAEYALILALVAVGVVVALTALGTGIGGFLTTFADTFGV